MPLPGVRAPGRRARGRAAPGSPELAARWLQSPSAGRTGRFAQGGFEPRDASQGTAAPRGAARSARGAGSLTPSPALLRRPLRRGLSRSLSAGSAAAPRAAHAAAPARPAQPRRRSIPRVCAAATTAAAATRRGRAGGRGLGRRGLGGRSRAAPAPPRSPRPAPYVTLWPPGLGAQPRGGGHGGVYGVPGRRPAVATRLPGSPSFPLETRHWHSPSPCPPRGLAQRQSKHSACGTEGTWATLRLQLQERGPRRGSDLPKDIHSALSPKSAESAMGTAVCPPEAPFHLAGPLQGFGSGHPHHEIPDPTPAAGVLGSSVGKDGLGSPD